MALAGCGGSNDSSPFALPTRSAAQLDVRVEVLGAVSGTSTFAQSADAATCAAFAAAARGKLFTIPSGLSTATVGGNPLALNATIVDYHGPGRYTGSAFGDPTTTTLTVDQVSSQDPFEPTAPGSGESAAVSADGSGSFTFSDWEDAALRTESGSVTWTCG